MNRVFTLFARSLAGALAAALSLSAQTPPAATPAAPASGPAIRFNTESYDFGKILKGDPVEYTFLATNIGRETLVITDAKGTCSCTVVGQGSNQNAWTPQEVPPGQTCRIPVQIATDGFSFQSISKAVEVTSNDKARPVVNLEIHGQVWLPIEVEPPISSFIISPGAANQTNDVLRIFNRSDTPLTLSDPQSDTTAFSAALKTNVPGREFELTVTAAPASVPPSIFSMTTIQGSISLKSSAAAMNPLKIGVSEIIYPEVTLFPTNIEMPAGPLSQAITNHITIRGNRANMTVSNPAANVPGVEMSVNVIQTNRQYYLIAVFPKEFVIQPGQNIILSVQTDNPLFPVLTVPIISKPGVINKPPVIPGPQRMSVLPASILAVPPAASNAPARTPPAPGTSRP